jgi:hypothetical protein
MNDNSILTNNKTIFHEELGLYATLRTARKLYNSGTVNGDVYPRGESIQPGEQYYVIYSGHCYKYDGMIHGTKVKLGHLEDYWKEKLREKRPDIKYGWDVSNVLSIEHRKHGLKLTEDGHTATLHQYGQPVAQFSGDGATISAIYQEADKHLPKRDPVQCMVDQGGIELGRSE